MHLLMVEHLNYESEIAERYGSFYDPVIIALVLLADCKILTPSTCSLRPLYVSQQIETEDLKAGRAIEMRACYESASQSVSGVPRQISWGGVCGRVRAASAMM